MRTAFFLLLLANVAFFAWSRYWADSQSGEAHLLAQQINPEAIRLLPPESPGAARRESPKPLACIEWGSFAAAEVAAAEAALAPLALGPKLTRRHSEEAAGWWVFMPPQGSRQAALNKVAELKRLGVEEHYVLPEDATPRFAISLGVFRSEDAAKSRLAELRAKGVRTAQIGPRQTAVERVHLQLREVPAPVAERLREIRLQFPGTDVGECTGGA